MEPLMDSFCVYHINALGQEENSPTLPSKYDSTFFFVIRPAFFVEFKII
jgi:hypothetical protein